MGKKLKCLLIFAFLFNIYILMYPKVSKWRQWNVGLRTVNETGHHKKSCFYLSWRSKLDLRKIREIVILNTHENSTVVLSPYTKNEYESSGIISNRCKRFVTLEKLFGRLGNQMFQIAALLGVAYKYDIIPVLPNIGILPGYINLPNSIKTSKEILNNAVRYDCHLTGALRKCPTGVLNSTSNITMYGFFQSYLHFDIAKDIIRKVFTLKTTHKIKADEFLRKSTKSGYQKVCFHIRRRDFLYERALEMGQSVANKEFIERAKTFYVKKYSKVQFVMLSNDKEWCKTHLKGDVISNFTDAGDDMALMTLCDHVVVTSGSFGWWGAWLSSGTTVYFKGYPRPGSKLDRRINRSEYYPSHWVGL